MSLPGVRNVTMVLAFLVMLVIVGAMALGVLFGRKPITGSCGGIAQLGMGTDCEVCGGNPAKCQEEKGGIDRAEDLAYDATRVRERRRD
jgi:uncharacterized protein